MVNSMFWTRSAAAMAAIAAMVTAPITARAQALKVGDVAPALSVSKWVKGDKVDAFKKGKLYVVEFWATWCGPCKVSIPHLTEMQKANPDVTFIGVSVWESKQEDVEPFVTRMGDKMAYTVAMDSIPAGANGLQGAMATSWMKAAGQNGIPTAFVVDGDGKIAWIGHPMVGLDNVVAKVKSGTFDPQAEAAAREKAEAAMASLDQQMQEVLTKARKDPRAAVEALDKIIAAHPEMAPQLGNIRFNLLLQSDEKAAYDYARKMADGSWKNQPMLLNNVAYGIADNGGKLKTPDYALALSLAKKAVDGTKAQDPTVLDTLAYAYFKTGDRKKAIATQKKALALLTATKEVNPELEKDLKAHLALFEGR